MDKSTAEDEISQLADRAVATEDSRAPQPADSSQPNPYQPTIAAERISGQLRPPVGILTGAAFGMAAAVLYTAANVALRQSVGVDAFLVSAVKAAPTVIVLGPVLIWMWLAQRTIATSMHTIPRFALCAFGAQILGNAGFQVALGVIGLAASVPITLGVLIISGAFFGRVMLGEPVRVRTVIAMITLILAVLVLSLPDATTRPAASESALPIWVGAVCAAASGASYALFGVAMRQSLTGGLSPQAAMFISGLVGTVSLWTIALADWFSALAAISSQQWTVMTLAGIFNFTAFVALSVALKALPVVAVNLINASQVAMAAVAGVLLFAEPVTWPLMTGIGLTFAGLMIMANRRKPKPPSA